MSALNIPNTPGSSGIDNVFTVINASTISYKGVLYEGVTDIAFPDGTHQSCSDILTAVGGSSYTPSELKPCVKVEGIDPDQNGKQLFSLYSTNSMQTGKNVSEVVPGGMWVEVFNFLGTPPENQVLKLWKDYFDSISVDYTSQYISTWLGFKMNYGTMERRSYVMTQLNDFHEESVPSPLVNVDVTYLHDVAINGVFLAPNPVGTGVTTALYVPIREFKLYRTNFNSNGQATFQRIPIDPVSVDFLDPVTGDGQAAFSNGDTFPHSVYTAWPPGSYYGVPYWLSPGVPNPAWSGGYFNARFGYRFLDNITGDQLLEALPSLNWDAPPPRTLKGLTAWRNGMMAAYEGNSVYLCEPYRPWAWPQIYIKVLPWSVMGLAVNENSLIAVTEGEPYIFNGSHPLNVSYERLQNVQAALKPTPVFVSPSAPSGYVNPTRAICRTPNGIVYACREGLIGIIGGRASMLLDALFTRDEWVQRYGPYFGVMRLAYFDERIVCYFDPTTLPEGTIPAGFIVNIAGSGVPQFTEFVPATSIYADFVLPQTDSMYVVTGSSPSVISNFGDENSSRLPCTYWTGDIIVPRPINPGVLQLVGVGTVTAYLIADGVFKAAPGFTMGDGANPGQMTQTLPDGYKARRFSLLFQVTAGALLSEAYLAGTRIELQSA